MKTYKYFKELVVGDVIYLAKVVPIPNSKKMQVVMQEHKIIEIDYKRGSYLADDDCWYHEDYDKDYITPYIGVKECKIKQ